VAGVELYDYRRDPQERVNAADDASYADVRRRMHGRLVDYLGRYAGSEVE
jgi:hypothetical protein